MDLKKKLFMVLLRIANTKILFVAMLLALTLVAKSVAARFIDDGFVKPLGDPIDEENIV